MAFKAESDDPARRSATSCASCWRGPARRVLCTDPYVDDERLVTARRASSTESDILVLGAPHKAVSQRSTSGGKDVVDVWGALGDGIRL